MKANMLAVENVFAFKKLALTVRIQQGFGRSFLRALGVACAVTLGFVFTPAQGVGQTSVEIIDATRHGVRGGRYSFVARFQTRLQDLLDRCGDPGPRIVQHGRQATGLFGQLTRRGLKRALACPPLDTIPADDRARDGILTRAVWDAIMNGAPPPSVQERAAALILTFEDTGFGDLPEWNFCQDSQLPPDGPAKVAAGRMGCVNRTDPCSLLTWGPRGATAGSGREIQLILWLAAQRAPDAVRRAFGSEFHHLPRFWRLKGGGPRSCSGDSDLELFMCAVWVDPVRKKIWEQALASLGRQEVVRRSYGEVYSAPQMDGWKMKEYYALWKRLGVAPSEIDYAFFLDRITHYGGPSPDGAPHLSETTLRGCIRDEMTAAFTPNGAARRCLARFRPHERQPVQRLARDVAFYLDAYRDNTLTELELSAWDEHIPVTAEHSVGLSDDRPAPALASSALDIMAPGWPRPDSRSVTAAERGACPAAVLKSVRPDY